MPTAVVSPVLISRESELAALRTAYSRVESGQSVTVLVSGEAGIGKSRLVSTAVGDIGGTPLVLTGDCLELGADGTPWVPFVAILRNLLREWGPDRLRAALPVGGSALAGWLPELSLPEAPGGHLRLFGEVLALLLQAAAERPLVLVVEDLHWADASSRELFVYLVRNLDAHAVLLIGTVRTGELPSGHPTRQLLAEIGRRAEVVRLDLAPLGRQEVSALLAAIEGRPPDPVASSAIHRRSNGNPLFVEALRAAGTANSDGLTTLLLDRVADLSPSARKVLATIAVAGGTVSDELLAEVSGEPVDDAVRELIERHQVAVHDDGYAIRHDLIREAVYGALLPGERRRLHSRYAEAIAAGSDSSAALAEHWTVAGEPAKALVAAWQAAAAAERQYAYDEHLNLLDRVLSLWTAESAELIGVSRATVQELATEASFTTGRSVAGVEHASAALADIDAVKEPLRRAALLRLRGLLQCRIDGGGTDDLLRALELVPEGTADALRGRLLAGLAFTEFVGSPGTAARQHAKQALELAERVGDLQVLADAKLILGGVLLHEGGPVKVAELLQEARAAAAAVGDQHTQLTSLQWEGLAMNLNGELEQAVALLEEAERLAESWGRMRARGSMLAQNRATALILLGRWDEALSLLDTALAAGPPAWYDASLRLLVADIAARRGEYDHAAEQFALMPVSPGTATELWRQSVPVRIMLEIGRGDLAAADRLLADLLAVLPEYLDVDSTGPGVYLAASRLEYAARGKQQLTVRAEDFRRKIPVSEPQWLDVEAVLRSGDALADGSLAAWDSAVEAWRRRGDVYEIALALTSAAKAALGSNNKSGARRRLEEARAIAAGLSAVPLLAEIDGLSERAGLSDDVPASALGLTAREVVVLKTLARGLSNAEIARELFVSPNTVATHVARILRKLEVTTRTEAAAVAHRFGLVAP
ncbi:ATP-binding protein [Kribbella sp. NPDC055071]